MALCRSFPGVPSGARSRNLLFHRQALCQLSYRHHDGEEWGGRVSRVLFPMVISLGPNRDRPRRHLRGGSRLPASASNLLAADSEIAAGRIALFTPVNRYWSLLLSRGLPRANLDCRRAVSRAPPRLSPGTRALCSSDFPLAPKRQRPSLPTPCLGCQCAGRLTSAVPKGRFELPRGYPHYALNVARLPVPPLRPAAYDVSA